MATSRRVNADPRLLAAFLGGDTLVDAASRAGVSEQTARRRLRNPAFRARLDAAGEELVAATTRALTDGSLEAVRTLHALLNDESSHVRVSAARALLDLGAKWRVEHALEERVAVVERRLVGLEKGR